jgi:DNA repair exonuclease SbcCD ATPase subunit
MVARADDPEEFLDLKDPESIEQIEDKVQKAQEQLLQLKRQQDLIEKQKRELEELARRQEQFQAGRQELIDNFTRALVVLDREQLEARKRVEQLNAIHDAFIHHLDVIEAINPKNWDNADLNKELSRALSAVDDARAEYNRSRALVSVTSETDPLAPEDAAISGGDSYQQVFGPEGHFDFLYWLKCGFAFTLPLIALGILGLVALFVFAK